MSEFKGVWIPAKLWLCKDLSLIEKHFLAKIRGLDNADGCVATNAFFADFFDLSKSRCTQILKILEDGNYIKITLFRENNEIVKRVVNLLNRGIEFFNEGSEKTKQGTLKIKQGIEKIKEGYLENSDRSNIEDKNKEEELNLEIESGGKKEPTHQNISEIDILKKQNETLLLEIELLKAEKEKEKNSAKKEKESNEPPHKIDALQSAWYSTYESNNLKPYQLKIKDYPFKNWSKELKEAFDVFCEGEYDNSKHKFSGTQAQELIRVVEIDLDKHGTDKVEKCLRLCALRRWAYEIDYQLNKEKRQIEDSKPKNYDKKPLHNNDLVMKGESLNHLNKWNKAK